VAKFGKDPIYRTKVIVRKPVWTPAIPKHLIRSVSRRAYNNIGVSCFFTKYTALRIESKDWLARNQIICLTGAACLPTDCCFSELAQQKYN
jgi:hypothetical protein